MMSGTQAASSKRVEVKTVRIVEMTVLFNVADRATKSKAMTAQI